MVTPSSQLLLKILRLKYLKVLPVGFVALLVNTSISMMVESVRSLSVKFALLYHKYILVIGTRDTLPAVIAMNEAIRTAKPGQEIIVVTDGNPSYPAGIHFINQSYEPNLTRLQTPPPSII